MFESVFGLPASFGAGASASGSGGSGRRGGRSRASVYSGDDSSRLLLPLCTLL